MGRKKIHVEGVELDLSDNQVVESSETLAAEVVVEESIEDTIEVVEEAVVEETDILCTLRPICLAVQEEKPYTILYKKVSYTFEPPDYTALLPFEAAHFYHDSKHVIVIK